MTDTDGRSSMRRVVVGTIHAELRLDDIVPADTPLAELTECALMGIVVNAGSRRGVVAHSSPRWPTWSSATWCFIEIGRRSSTAPPPHHRTTALQPGPSSAPLASQLGKSCSTSQGLWPPAAQGAHVAPFAFTWSPPGVGWWWTVIRRPGGDGGHERMPGAAAGGAGDKLLIGVPEVAGGLGGGQFLVEPVVVLGERARNASAPRADKGRNSDRKSAWRDSVCDRLNRP